MRCKRSHASILGLLAALTVAAALGSPVGAFEVYREADPGTQDCEDCHGDFRDSPYVSFSDGSNWGDDLHDVHRDSMLGGECNVCHSGRSRTPVLLGSSNGVPGLQPVSCIGCHGRAGEGGAGLRQHHWNAGERLCVDCHDDADPRNFTPAGEDVLPPYYADPPNAAYPDIPTDSCNRSPDFTEQYAGTTLGLDNDGDLFYDTTDSDCPLLTTTTTTTTTTTSTTTTAPPSTTTTTTVPPGTTTTTTVPPPTTTTTTVPRGTTTTTTVPPSTTTTTTTTTVPPGTTTTTTLPTVGKVVMCHKGKRTIAAKARAVSKHLAHGDPLGACPNSSKVVICHKGRRTILVSLRAETKHLAHGDTPGVCSESQPGAGGDRDDDDLDD